MGKAGRLLTDIIEKGMRLARSEVYIANVVKCRPPDNQDPEPLDRGDLLSRFWTGARGHPSQGGGGFGQGGGAGPDRRGPAHQPDARSLERV